MTSYFIFSISNWWLISGDCACMSYLAMSAISSILSPLYCSTLLRDVVTKLVLPSSITGYTWSSFFKIHLPATGRLKQMSWKSLLRWHDGCGQQPCARGRCCRIDFCLVVICFCQVTGHNGTLRLMDVAWHNWMSKAAEALWSYKACKSSPMLPQSSFSNPQK